MGCSSRGHDNQDLLYNSLSMFNDGSETEAVEILANVDIADQLQSSSVELGRMSESDFLALRDPGAAQEQLIPLVILVKRAGKLQVDKIAQYEGQGKKSEAQELKAQMSRLIDYLGGGRTVALERVSGALNIYLSETGVTID